MLRRRQRAVTLLEVLLVITLIGVLVAFAWPEFSNASRTEQLRESARRFQSLVAMCRAEAMNEARQYRIEFRADGSLVTRRQVDALYAPQVYEPVVNGWAQTEVLLPEVWVEGLQLLPEGPAPIRVVDEELVFPDAEYEFTPVTDLEAPLAFDFAPDGSCASLRCVLRDTSGRATVLTLDGRLGRVAAEDWEAMSAADAQRPPALEQEDEETIDRERLIEEGRRSRR